MIMYEIFSLKIKVKPNSNKEFSFAAIILTFILNCQKALVFCFTTQYHQVITNL